MSKGEAEQQVFFSSDADMRSQDADILYGTDEAGGRMLAYLLFGLAFGKPLLLYAST